MINFFDLVKFIDGSIFHTSFCVNKKDPQNA